MRRFSIFILLVAFLLPTILSAGGKKAPSSQSVYRQIEQGIPGASFKRESRVRLGRVAMALVKPVAWLALDKDDEARVYLSAIKSVDIATYRVVEMPDAVDVGVIGQIEARLLENGWQKIVRSREGKENSWVFSRHRDDGSIRGILVIALDRYELEIVGVEGRLDEILAQAIAEEPGEFSGLFGS